jgi:SecD/SecF fusion protein
MFANIALIYNMLFLLVVLVSFEATLTLPGIAGLVLTLGMAVDANIIIYERIREELGLGKDLRTAISDGYDRAHLTVLDSNLTTMIAGIVLLEYGSGPVKGFAVTLIIGLITSYVTSIWFSKYCFDLLMDLGWKQHNLFTPKKGSL